MFVFPSLSVMDRIRQLRNVGLFDARVPRYTSYPPANHFSSDVGGRDTQSWLNAVPEGTQVSLYVHIPFCRRLCWFCACRTQGTSSLRPLEGYLAALDDEIDLVASSFPKGVQVGRLHWGGGTPTLLSAPMIKALMGRLKSKLPLATDIEFSVEIDPCEIDGARMDALLECGMSRASLGVQDFDHQIQEVIGRIQSFETTKQVVDELRARGIQSLNIDLLYGLPHQTETRISDSVQKVLSLSPDRVALYGYAHVPWMARRQSLIPTDALPTPEGRFLLSEAARKLFVWDGYDEVGIDHFAQPEDGLAVAARTGTLRRNFQGYTDDRCPVLVGLGASAISQYPQGFAQNSPVTSKYTDLVSNGHFATVRGHKNSPDDLVRSLLIERLMCDFEIDFAEVAKNLGVPEARIAERCEGLENEFPGVVVETSGGMKIVRENWCATRLVANRLDAYAVKQAGHSPAI